MSNITEKESVALSYIRISAVTLIVLCHYWQAFDNHWAYILNVGVQLFIVLSGFLYGHKIISEWSNWWSNRMKKLYLPVFTFLTLVTPLYLLFRPENINLLGMLCNYMNLQGFPFVFGGVTLVQGTRHLWFITAILMAYSMTPLLQRLKVYAVYVFMALWTIQIISYIILPKPIAFMLSWFTLYGIGYSFANMTSKHRNIALFLLLVVASVLLYNIQWEQIHTYFNPLNRLLHDVLGCVILFGGYKLLCNISNIRLTRLTAVIDRYSFHIYIIHYLLLIGPFSLLNITNSTYLNISISIMAIIAISWIFVLICQSLYHFLFVNKVY